MKNRNEQARLTRAQLLLEIEQIPDDAFVSSRHAAVLLHTSTGRVRIVPQVNTPVC